MKISAAFAATLLALAPVASQAADFACDEDIAAQSFTAAEQVHVDLLWDQTLSYLAGFHGTLMQPAGCLDSASSIIETSEPAASECIARYRDVELAVKHLDWILDNPDAAKTCFDPQKTYETMALYTPSPAIQAASAASAWLDRPLLGDFYAAKGGAIGAAGQELARDFAAILAQSVMPSGAGRDVTYNALPDLWSSVGWLPFYADNAAALNPRFRGGYAYAEVMGPWGMLRIAEIGGEPVGLELGMTIQLGDTFYPYHYHHPQEIYITLSPTAQEEQNQFMVMHWDNPELEQERHDSQWAVSVSNPGRAMDQWFRQQSPGGNWLSYFERNAIHSFHVGKGTDDAPGGLVTIWARTTARDNNQTTRICELLSEPASAERPATPSSSYRCLLDDWEK